ncbi:hypothetical protein D3C73_1177080 [compost metagenome]
MRVPLPGSSVKENSIRSRTASPSSEIGASAPCIMETAPVSAYTGSSIAQLRLLAVKPYVSARITIRIGPHSSLTLPMASMPP